MSSSYPPTERLGCSTYVKEFSDKLIKEVVLRKKKEEVDSFYVHNNIASIEAKKWFRTNNSRNKIQIIHSQIKPELAEKNNRSFWRKRVWYFTCNFNVESGLHLPNANSIIIDGADRFGIADLHQLRGRVGQSNKEGFCYYVVEDKKQITDDAVKDLLLLNLTHI